jgi:hypothetical protein
LDSILPGLAYVHFRLSVFASFSFQRKALLAQHYANAGGALRPVDVHRGESSQKSDAGIAS